MKLDALTIAGFFHFDAPATLDLAALPEGLIALVGPNGHGKTRLLDAPLASLYGPGGKPRAFPSREGTLAEYATSKDAYIETTWTVRDAFGHRQLRARVNVDGEKRATEAVLGENCDKEGGTRLGFMPINDGKASTFVDAVAARFPSRRSVLCSAFAAQSKAGSFVELGQKERLELFAELADLGHYQEKAATAKRCADIAETVGGKLRSQLALLEPEASPAREQELLAQQQEIAEGLTFYGNKRSDARTLISALEVERVSLETAARTGAAAEAEANGLRQRLVAIQHEIDGAVNRLTQAEAEAEKARQAIEAGIVADQTLLAKADEIRRQAAEKRQQEQRLTQTRSLAEAILRRIADDTRELHRCELALRQAERTADDLAAAVRQASFIAMAPFGEKCAPCDFMADAREARDRIPGLEQTVASAGALAAEVAEYRDVVALAQEALKTYEEVVGAADAAIRGLTLAADEPSLALAEQRLTHYQQQQADVEARRKAVVADVNARCLALETEQAQKRSRLTAAQETVERTKNARHRLAETDQRLARHRENLVAVEQQLALAEARQRLNFEQQSKLAQLRQVLEEGHRRRRLVEDEGLAWQTLARACGRDGLPKLEIDAAGPIVSSYCNELLAGAFGTRFSLEVVTQLPTADGKGLKEGFTIQVLDNAHEGEARDIADLSGGERVIVEEALRAALACYVNHRNRTPVQTLWRDETTGALDPANAPRYVALLRSLLALSGATQILFVTHAPDCAALADAQVHVEDGIPTVVLPPYAEAL